jgi:hypothetical protein
MKGEGARQRPGESSLCLCKDKGTMLEYVCKNAGDEQQVLSRSEGLNFSDRNNSTTDFCRARLMQMKRKKKNNSQHHKPISYIGFSLNEI